jgi:hypothetical protein
MIGRNRVRAIQDAVTLQYANGKSLARQTPGSGRFTPYVGFHIEVGKDAELDTALQTAGLNQIEIKHQRSGGAEIVRHWAVGEHSRIYPVTSGPVAPSVASSLAGNNAQATAEAGIGLRWGNGERSKMAIRGYLDVLVRAGFLRLVQLSVRSRMTDVLLGALLEHCRVCEAADNLIDRNRHPELVSFHEIALPLGPGEEEEWGKGDTATVVPFACTHPDQVTAEYLRGVWRPDSVQAAALRDWESIQLWASEYASQSDESVARPPEEAAMMNGRGTDDLL